MQIGDRVLASPGQDTVRGLRTWHIAGTIVGEHSGGWRVHWDNWEPETWSLWFERELVLYTGHEAARRLVRLEWSDRAGR